MTTKSFAATLQSTLRAPVVHGHGGRRVGSGRKKTGNLSVMVRLNEAQKELFDNIGGSAFLQAISTRSPNRLPVSTSTPYLSSRF